MIELAIVLFCIAATGGITIVSLILMKRNPPWWLSIAHASMGASGLVLLLVELISKEDVLITIKVAFVIFCVTALGGFALASFHFRKKRHPRFLIFVHALLAVTALSTLLAGYFGLAG